VPVDAGCKDVATDPAACMLHASDASDAWLAVNFDTENGLRGSASWYCQPAFVEVSISARWYASDTCIQQRLPFR
jgi:hypothetical protein